MQDISDRIIATEVDFFRHILPKTPLPRTVHLSLESRYADLERYLGGNPATLRAFQTLYLAFIALRNPVFVDRERTRLTLGDGANTATAPFGGECG
jgi:hypothetical protein